MPPASSAAAIESIAVHAIQTGAKAQKAIEKKPPASAAADPLLPTSGLADGIAAMDWPELAQAIASCQACKLCAGRRAAVFGGALAEAPQRADWLVLGDPPEDAEERQGAPFVEQAGQLLDNMLKAVGVSRRQPAGSGGAVAATAAYVTNVVKCRPGVVRNPTAQELALCETYLRREVALVQPKVIVTMGRFAALTLLRGSLPEGVSVPLGKLRGQVYRYQGIPVVVTYPPAYLLRTQQDKARTWADLCRAMALVRDAA
jgi:DNA polymerase